MKKTNHLFLLFLIISIVAASCSTSGRMGSKKGCGCGVHKGFVGY